MKLNRVVVRDDLIIPAYLCVFIFSAKCVASSIDNYILKILYKTLTAFTRNITFVAFCRIFSCYLILNWEMHFLDTLYITRLRRYTGPSSDLCVFIFPVQRVAPSICSFCNCPNFQNSI